MGAIFSLLGNMIALGAKGIGFIANNLWMLVLFLTWFTYDEVIKPRFQRKGKSRKASKRT